MRRTYSGVVESPRVEIVRTGLERFNAREYEQAADDLSPDMVWDTTGVVPDGEAHRGRETVVAYWRDVGERWGEIRIEPDEWIEAEDCVVMLGRLVGRGSGSGAPVEGPWNQVWRFDGDVPVSCENFGDRDAALRAAKAG